MDANEIIRDITTRRPAPPEAARAHYGSWVEPARAVMGLVKLGWGVSAAVTEVAAKLGLAADRKAFGSIRACYYNLRRRDAAEQQPEPEDDI